MRSVECQVAVAAAAARSMGVAASDPARLVAGSDLLARLAGSGLLARVGLGPQVLAVSGPQVLADFIRRPVDSDPAPASVHLVQGSERLLHRTGHSRREALCPTGESSAAITADLDFAASTAFTIAVFSLTTVSDAARPSFSEAGFSWDHPSFPFIPATMATTSETITATDLRLSNSL